MSLNEVVLVHFMNLSTEIVRDGLMKEYEPAVDRLMYWLYAEFRAHAADVVDWSDEKGVISKRKMGDLYSEITNRRFGDPSINDKDRGMRIREKEMLLSALLYAHKVNLGGGKGVQFEKATEADYANVLEEDEEEDSGGYSGTPGQDRPDVA